MVLKAKIFKIFTISLFLFSITRILFAESNIRERIKTKIEDRREHRSGTEITALGVGDYKFSIQFDGRERFYIAHIPHSYNKYKPTPLVLVMHGGGGNPEEMSRDTGMNNVSDRNNFIVAYPAGTAARFKNRFLTWGTGCADDYASVQNIDDVGFLRKVIEDVSSKFNINQKMIYSTGISEGAMMSYRLACELSDKIAAIAPVAGTITFSDCIPDSHVSVIHFHGLEDKFALYNGGANEKHIVEPVLSVNDTIAFWVKKNGLLSNSVAANKIGNAEMLQYGPGDDGVEVVLWTIKDGGHTWPGGNMPSYSLVLLGNESHDINASELMWSFFKAHPKK